MFSQKVKSHQWGMRACMRQGRKRACLAGEARFQPNTKRKKNPRCFANLHTSKAPAKPVQGSVAAWDLAAGKPGLPTGEAEDGQELSGDCSRAYSLSGKCQRKFRDLSLEHQAQCGAQSQGLAHSLSTGGGCPA